MLSPCWREGRERRSGSYGGHQSRMIRTNLRISGVGGTLAWFAFNLKSCNANMTRPAARIGKLIGILTRGKVKSIFCQTQKGGAGGETRKATNDL